MFDAQNEDDLYYYDPENEGQFEPDFIMDDEIGLTWADVCMGLRNLNEEKGHSGPYTADEFFDAVSNAYVKVGIEGLMEKGLLDSCMNREGEMGYMLSELGKEATKEMMNEDESN